MTRFLRVTPKDHRVTPVEADQPHNADPDLYARGVDHGVVSKDPDGGGIGVFVYEYGLLDGDGPYFALGGQLYSGDAILYAFDEAGETIDMPQGFMQLKPLWLDTKADVELAITAGVIERPQAAINGVVTWQWS